jgi:hypothetical protein
MPVQGRWLSPDPAGLTAVDPTSTLADAVTGELESELNAVTDVLAIVEP